MTVHLQQIDITPGGTVRVSGHVSATNITIALEPRIYIQPPSDNIWEYDIAETVNGNLGGASLTSFSADAIYPEAENPSGVRVYVPGGGATTKLMLEEVNEFTESAQNHIRITGVGYDRTLGDLIIDVDYSGGCFEHAWRLEWDGKTLESQPPQYKLQLVDLSPYDACEAMISRQLRIDVTTPGVSFLSPSLLLVGTPNSQDHVPVAIGFSEQVELIPGEPINDIDGGLSLQVNRVQDSRCPVGAQCIWAGEATVELTGAKDSKEFAVALSSLDRRSVKLDDSGYSLELLSVTPYPSRLSSRQGSTLVTVRVSRS